MRTNYVKSARSGLRLDEGVLGKAYSGASVDEGRLELQADGARFVRDALANKISADIHPGSLACRRPNLGEKYISLDQKVAQLLQLEVIKGRKRSSLGH